MTMLGAPTTRADLVATRDSFSQPETSDQKLWRTFGKVLGAVIALYLFFDRGFAHFHIPHTPAYVGELVIAFGLICAAVSTRWVRRALSGDSLMAVTIAWMLWGAVRTIPNMSTSSGSRTRCTTLPSGTTRSLPFS